MHSSSDTIHALIIDKSKVKIQSNDFVDVKDLIKEGKKFNFDNTLQVYDSVEARARYLLSAVVYNIEIGYVNLMRELASIRTMERLIADLAEGKDQEILQHNEDYRKRNYATFYNVVRQTNPKADDDIISRVARHWIVLGGHPEFHKADYKLLTEKDSKLLREAYHIIFTDAQKLKSLDKKFEFLSKGFKNIQHIVPYYSEVVDWYVRGAILSTIPNITSCAEFAKLIKYNSKYLSKFVYGNSKIVTGSTNSLEAFEAKVKEVSQDMNCKILYVRDGNCNMLTEIPELVEAFENDKLDEFQEKLVPYQMLAGRIAEDLTGPSLLRDVL